MRNMLSGLAALAVVTLFDGPVYGQAFVAPSPAPLVTAANADWFRFGEPLSFAGAEYMPLGPRVFFDPNVMVRVGAYRGIPLYVDTTLEPYSVLFVPAAPNVMQPYERRRTDDLAGTTGSRTPSLPIDYPSDLLLDRAAQYARAGAVPFGNTGVGSAAGGAIGPEGNSGSMPTAAVSGVPAGRVVAMSAPPLPLPGTFTADQALAATRRGESGIYVATRTGAIAGEAVGTAGRPTQPARTTGSAERVMPPRARETTAAATIWIEYEGSRRFSAGRALPLSAMRFTRVGDYHGHAVYRMADGDPGTIYVESRPGFVAPFKK